MSEVEHKTGKLTKIELQGDLQNTARCILEKEFPTYFDINDKDYIEQLIYDIGYGLYVVVNNILYEVEYEDVNVFDDIFKSKHNKDGTISFEVKYYNGGCGFGEALEYAIEGII